MNTSDLEVTAMNEAAVVGRLTRWARWKLGSGEAQGYPSRAAFTNEYIDGRRPEDIDPSYNSECDETHKGYTQLPDVYQAVIRIEYLSTLSTVKLKSYKYGKDKRTYHRDLKQSYLLLGNILFNMRGK